MLISKFKSTDIVEKLEEYEDVLGTSIPSQFRAFLQKYNGGETPQTVYKCGKVSFDIKALYGLGDVKYSLDNTKPIDRDGIRYLPIGCDTFGNEIVLDLTTGNICFLNHENGTVMRIEDDFKLFVSKCKSEGIKKSSLKSIEEREADLIKKGRGHIITDALRDMWQAEIDKNSSMVLEEILID